MFLVRVANMLPEEVVAFFSAQFLNERGKDGTRGEIVNEWGRKPSSEAGFASYIDLRESQECWVYKLSGLGANSAVRAMTTQVLNETTQVVHELNTRSSIMVADPDNLGSV